LYLVLLGAPGAGKGTQAETVTKELGLAHVATGDLFRHALGQGTELGLKAKTYMEQGKLVPDDITINMVLERIALPDCEGGIALDGFPRNLEQARALDLALEARGQQIDRAVYIKVDVEELKQRLGGRWVCRGCQAPYHEVNTPPKVAGVCDKCSGELYQRADDNSETIANRLKVYFEETAPLIDYYAAAGKLLEVDGAGDVGDVSQRIISGLK
jgi:adenylate kinase